MSASEDIITFKDEDGIETTVMPWGVIRLVGNRLIVKQHKEGRYEFKEWTFVDSNAVSIYSSEFPTKRIARSVMRMLKDISGKLGLSSSIDSWVQLHKVLEISSDERVAAQQRSELDAFEVELALAPIFD